MQDFAWELIQRSTMLTPSTKKTTKTITIGQTPDKELIDLHDIRQRPSFE
jgi:hypothetical protein